MSAAANFVRWGGVIEKGCDCARQSRLDVRSNVFCNSANEVLRRKRHASSGRAVCGWIERFSGKKIRFWSSTMRLWIIDLQYINVNGESRGTFVRRDATILAWSQQLNLEFRINLTSGRGLGLLKIPADIDLRMGIYYSCSEAGHGP